MEYTPKKVDTDGSEGDASPDPIVGKDIPISLTVEDDPDAVVIGLKSHRPKGKHRPTNVKAEITLNILDTDTDDKVKHLAFMYQAYKLNNGNLEKKANILAPYDPMGHPPTNPPTLTIEALDDTGTILVGLNVSPGPGPETFYVAVHVKITAAGDYEGNDEIFVRFDK